METISFYTVSMVDFSCKGLVVRSLDVFLLFLEQTVELTVTWTM